MNKLRKIIFVLLAVVILVFLYDSLWGKYRTGPNDMISIKVTDGYGNSTILDEDALGRDILRQFRDRENVTTEGKCLYDNELYILKNGRKILKAKVSSDGSGTAIVKGKTYNTNDETYKNLLSNLEKKGVFLENIKYLTQELLNNI